MLRRTFLQQSLSTTGIVPWIITQSKRASANDRIGIAMIGVRGRGNALLHAFASCSDVQVLSICDVDHTVLQKRTEEISKDLDRKPEMLSDFRHAMDDQNVDVVVLGTPDHWHAIPTIMACQAVKDVYVEKPDSHNLVEGRCMVEASKKYGRIIQMGTQSRSRPFMYRAMDYIRQGNLGKVLVAKAWESARQGSIGHPENSEVPEGVDYEMWLGPAPKRPFNIRRFHSSWRWFFDYGTGDLGNDGVHRLDIARWALETAVSANGDQLPQWPKSVAAQGGKCYFDDDQEWPDTLMATYDYDGFVLTYEMRVWTPYPYYGEHEGAVVYGDQGYIVIGNSRWRAFDAKGKQITEDSGGDDTQKHVQNFLDCCRNREKPTADLETVGHPSSVLCHLGNAAWRAGNSLNFDPQNYSFSNDEEANQFRTRAEYRKPWTLPKLSEI